jgi:hypothetical protein
MMLLFASTVKIAFAEEYSENHEKAKRYFLSDEEPIVKDATWTAENIFKVGVIDDGSNRNGYASYVCLVLSDYGFQNKKIYVQVIDIVKLRQQGKWVKLGECHCP